LFPSESLRVSWYTAISLLQTLVFLARSSQAKAMFPSVENALFSRFSRMPPLPPPTPDFPFVLMREGVDLPLLPFPLRHQDFFSIYVVRQGRGSHKIDNAFYGLARGDVFVMTPGMTHEFVQCEKLAGDTLHFSPAVLDKPTRTALADEPAFENLFGASSSLLTPQHQCWLHLTPDEYDRVGALLEEMRLERERGTRSAALIARAGLLRLLVLLCRRFEEARPAHPRLAVAAIKQDPVAAAVRTLDAHFTEPLRIEDLAASVFLSPDRFTIVFTARMGRTPSDYLRYLRLERAKRLLLTTDLAILAVGRQSGFSQHKHFDATFKSATGLTPRQFRRQGSAPKLSGT